MFVTSRGRTVATKGLRVTNEYTVSNRKSPFDLPFVSRSRVTDRFVRNINTSISNASISSRDRTITVSRSYDPVRLFVQTYSTPVPIFNDKFARVRPDFENPPGVGNYTLFPPQWARSECTVCRSVCIAVHGVTKCILAH